MNYDTLTAELALPLYDGTTDQEAADELNAVDKVVDVETVTSQQIFEAVVPAEYTALTSDQKTMFWGILGMGDIYVNNTNTRIAITSLFSPGDTLSALADLQTQTISRATELGLGFVYAGHIQNARAL